jgi:hypothetical protein
MTTGLGSDVETGFPDLTGLGLDDLDPADESVLAHALRRRLVPSAPEVALFQNHVSTQDVVLFHDAVPPSAGGAAVGAVPPADAPPD